MIIRPHDFIWIEQPRSLYIEGISPDWIFDYWNSSLPVVVRRAPIVNDLIPVGIRGKERSQRQAAYIPLKCIKKIMSPELLLNVCYSNNENNLVLNSLTTIKKYPHTWVWGVTGSCGYQLATGIKTLNNESDLDLLIRCPNQISFELLERFSRFLSELPIRVDVQIETGYGGFALKEWIRDKKVLLKTINGPIITHNPWQYSSK